MKVVIIGGGIAGLSMANFLLQKGIEVSLHEREHSNQPKGHAFLMHPEGISFLKVLGKSKSNVPVPGQIINEIIIGHPDGSKERNTQLENWLCLSRAEMVQYLNYLLPAGIVKFGHAFAGFEYSNERISAVHFSNGDFEKGDVFIAADGAKSLIRQELFGETAFSPVEVKEIVGVVHLPGLISKHPNSFRKFISDQKGLAIGFVPCNKDKLVWFMQYDVQLYRGPAETAADLENLCRNLLSEFHEDARLILDHADFNNVYVWNSTDFEILPTFHENNLFLIGDAAHLALPFTSSGTTNALQDAWVLSSLIEPAFNPEEAGKKYYEIRSPIIRSHIEFGRSLKEEFLQPGGKESSIPLIRVK